MLTKNFFNFVMAQTALSTVNGNAMVDYTGAAFASNFNTTSNCTGLKSIATLAASAISTSNPGVRIGNGVTPPTVDDYNLESMITSGFTCTNPSAPAISLENDGVSISATYGITNTGTTAMTISEIGLFGKITNSNITVFLLERTVLESPITINPGETKQVTYTIRFNYPTE